MKQAELNEGVTSPNQNKARIDEMKIKTWEVLFFFFLLEEQSEQQLEI